MGMTRSITFQADEVTEAALAELVTGNDGADETSVICAAILDAVGRQRLREETRRLAADPVDLAEIARVRADMEDLRVW